jgi:beta-galactosidase
MNSRNYVALISLLLMVSSARAIGSETASDTQRERQEFNEGWSFHKGDPEGTADALSYFKNPAVKDAVIASASTNVLSEAQQQLGSAVTFTRPEFDEKGWRRLDLPHDWGIEGPFDINLPGNTGKLPWSGVAWYRKHFSLPASDAGKRISLEIDGAMSCPMIWCNGHFVGGWPYGYSSFSLNLTPFLKPGGENVLAVRLDNPDNSSRWYPGGGIYRNVWLTKTSPVHVAHWGTTVTTPNVSDSKASVKVSTKVVNEQKDPVTATLSTELISIDGSNRPVGIGITLSPVTATIAPGGELRHDQAADVANPKLWDTNHPDRYAAITTVSVDGKVVDRVETPFGIRSIKFTKENGFLLNGKRLQLQGVCDHHDLGALGTAFNLRAAERQLQILKEMGVNALRTSHNMPAPELLDLCDRMGILVMDESFDCWARGKTPNDYSRFWNDWHEKDLRAEIRRDRNHPSVIMWSLGNEINEQGKAEAVPIVEELVRIAHEEDFTRPATAGGNGVIHWNPRFAGAYDILGENYEPGNYAAILKRFPDKPLFASETSSCVSSRGEYFFQSPEGMAAFNEGLRKREEDRHDREVKKAQAAGKPTPVPREFKPRQFTSISLSTHEGGMENFQVSSYDLYAPGWAQTPDQEFAGLDAAPSVAGEFVWTGFDYLGEPTPFNADVTNLLNFRNDPAKQAEMEKQLKELGKVRCPSRSSYFGVVDLCGFPKDRFYLYQSRWRPELPMVHILPHWNWPDRVGKVTPVHLYTSGDEAELFLNGKSLGRKKKGAKGDGNPNLANSCTVTASSEEKSKRNLASLAIDQNDGTVWIASDGSPGQWWSADLGGVRKVRQITLLHEREAEKYTCLLEASDDGTHWRPLSGVTSPVMNGKTAFYDCDDCFRYLKVTFPSLRPGVWASLAEVGIYGKPLSTTGTPYRICWDDVVYEPGELKAVAYKNGKPWAEETVRTTGPAAKLILEPDRDLISNDGRDLSFVKLTVRDKEGLPVPRSSPALTFEISGPGEIIATDNGDATDLTAFSSKERKAYNGLALVIVRAKKGESGPIILKASSEGLASAETKIETH